MEKRRIFFLYFGQNVISSHCKGNGVPRNLGVHLEDSLLNLLVREVGEGGGVPPPEPLEPLLLAPFDWKAHNVKLHFLEAGLLQHRYNGSTGESFVLLLFDLPDGVGEGVVEYVVRLAPHNQHKPICSQLPSKIWQYFRLNNF